MSLKGTQGICDSCGGELDPLLRAGVTFVPWKMDSKAVIVLAELANGFGPNVTLCCGSASVVGVLEPGFGRD